MTKALIPLFEYAKLLIQTFAVQQGTSLPFALYFSKKIKIF